MIFNGLFSMPFIYLATKSRAFNIFNIEEHSYIEHFIYGTVGIPAFIALIMLLASPLLSFFRNKTVQKDVRVEFFMLLAIVFLVFLSYISEYHRDGNLVNHFWFDVFSILIGFFFYYFIFKGKTIKYPQKLIE